MQHYGTKRHEVLARFMLGFEGMALPDELAGMLANGLAGVALYPRNFRTLDELLALTAAIRQAAQQPVLIGIDQEGGTKFSLGPPFTPWPSPADLGRLGDASLVEQIARASARELRAAGINLNFAPMLDLATNPDSPVTRGRSFSPDPQIVANMGAAFLRGIAAEGILPCAKHFPGHGDAAIDPHHDLPQFEGSREHLARHELLPFAAAIDAGVPLIMTAHILLPRVDPERPASMSPLLLEQILRCELHFEGVILADDLGMGAISRRYGAGESAVKTLQAGTDIAMLCHDWQAVETSIEAVTKSRAAGEFDQSQWQQSAARLAALRDKISALDSEPPKTTDPAVQPTVEIIGCAENGALAATAAHQIAQARDAK